MKCLFLIYIDELVSWLLSKHPIEYLKVHKVDLPISSFVSDHVFDVLLENGEEILLHLEFEAHVSAEVMAFRMLEY